MFVIALFDDCSSFVAKDADVDSFVLERATCSDDWSGSSLIAIDTKFPLETEVSVELEYLNSVEDNDVESDDDGDAKWFNSAFLEALLANKFVIVFMDAERRFFCSAGFF